jgi:N-acyl homoserine lactone hydrolase
LARRLAIFTDHNWTDWLPTYAWVIEHREGVIVVDTGQGVHLLETGRSLHPISDGKLSFALNVKRRLGRHAATIWRLQGRDDDWPMPITSS